MQHIITIQCGKDLRSWRTIHEQVFCSFSKKMTAISVEAESYREAFKQAEDILDQFELITSSQSTPQRFEKQHIGSKVCFPPVKLAPKTH